MTLKRIIARNVVWNWAGMAIPMLAGFLVAPFLVHRLGEQGYGLWIVIGSLTSYFGLLDLGIRGSVGRYIAYHHARNEPEGVHATLSTALALLSLASLVALLGTALLLQLFPRLVEVPPEEQTACHWALLIVGVNLALSLPFNVFDAYLWAHQRFDILNAIDIPTVIVRTALTFLFIADGYGLVALALITFLTTTSCSLLKLGFSLWLGRAFRLHPHCVRGSALRELYSFGIWLFLISVTRLVLSSINPVIIANQMGAALVTPFSIASRLMSYAGSLLLAGANVLTPVATTFHAQDAKRDQDAMLVQGGRYCTLLALFILTSYAFLGRSLIRLWMGPSLLSAYPLLLILTLGETLPMSQWVTYSMVLGIGRHRFIAFVYLAEAITAVALTFFFLPRIGLAGACVALAVPALVGRGMIQLAYGCRVVGVPVVTYVRQGMLPPLAGALPSALVLALLVRWHEPRNWLEFAAYAAVYATSFLTTWVLFFDWQQVCMLRDLWLRGSWRAGRADASRAKYQDADASRAPEFLAKG